MNKLNKKTEERLFNKVRKLSDDWFEHDSGDGFGRASDEEIIYISQFLASELSLTRKEVIEVIESFYNPTIVGGIINRGHSCLGAEIKACNKMLEDILTKLR